MRLANLGLGKKLFVAVAIPFVVALALTGYHVALKWNTRAEMVKLRELTAGVAEMSRLIHELQRERGASAVFVGSKGAQLRDELPAQRKLTDGQRAAVTSRMAQLRAENGSEEFNAEIASAENAVGALDATRKQIDSFSITATESNTYFSNTIAQLLTVTSSLTKTSSRSDVTVALSAYVAFMKGKELAGQERATGAAGVSTGKFELPGYVRVLGLRAAQESYFGVFDAAATPEQRAFYKQTVSGPVIDELAKMREAIAARGLVGDLGFDGKAWYETTTARINLFKKVEDRLAADLDAASAGIESEATTSLATLAGGASIVLILCFCLVVIVARDITRPAAALTDAMRELARGNWETAVPGTERGDELGEMADAVRIFKQAGLENARLEAEAAANRAAAEAERERTAAERARAAEEQAQAVHRLGSGLKDLAAGDLTIRLNDGFSASYAQIRDDFNGAIDKLKETILTVVSSAGAIESGTQEISTATDDLSRRTEQQASSLEETAAALDEISATVKKSAEAANHARAIVAAADEHARKSAVVVRQAVEAMDAISKSARQIGQIVGVIDEIAFQTNLLALNAGVEAARAGDSGRGFAVVASEVRALAQRSADAAKEIKGLISISTAQVEQGVQLVAGTGASLEQILAQVTEINNVVGAVAVGAQEQASGLAQVNTALNQMDQVTQQNAAMAEETTAASHSLSQETSRLSGLIAQFQVGRAGDDAAIRDDLKKVAPHAFGQPSKPQVSGARRPQVVVANEDAPTQKGKPLVRAMHGAKVANGDADQWEEF